MNDSEVSELLSIYDNIVLKNLPFCSICLRVEDERRLVQPRAMKQLFEALNLPKDYRGNTQPVCYMCESYAASVIRFHTVVMSSASMQELFHDMLLRKQFENQVRVCFRKHQGAKIVHNKIHKQALECEMQLKKIRSRFRLQQTEVLVIDSDGVTLPGTESETITDDPLVETALNNMTPCPGVDTVIILDDEDEPKMIKRHQDAPTDEVIPEKNTNVTPKLVPIEKLLETPSLNQNVASLLPNQLQVIMPERTENAASNFMLHPIVIQNDGSFNVPSLSAKLVNGSLVFGENTNPLLKANASNPTILVGSQDKSAIYIGNQNKASILLGTPDKSAVRYQSNNLTTLVGASNDLVGNGNKSVENGVSNIIIKEGSVTCLNEVESALDRILKEKVDELTNNYKRSYDGSNGSNKKRALDSEKEREKESRIDWEDKIPMDVISFMDAVDPLADPKLRSNHSAGQMGETETLITSDLPPRQPPPTPAVTPAPPLAALACPMGVISEVRSVVEANISTQTDFETDIIDLC